MPATTSITRETYDLHGSMVYALCRRFLDEADAAAVTRDVFIAAARNDHPDLRDALLAEARRCIVERGGDDDSIALAVERLRIADAVRQLAEPRRTILTLALVDRLDHDEVATRTSLRREQVAGEIVSGLSDVKRLLRPSPSV